MKKTILAAVSLLASTVICSASAFADAITTKFDILPPYLSVPSIADWATSSQDMNGMRITATFYDGTSQTVLWGNRSGGGAVGSGWELYMSSYSGNTLVTPWILDSSGAEIMSLFIEGQPGNTMFDIDPRVGSAYSTTGSRDGVPFADSYVDSFGQLITDSVVAPGLDIVALYSTLVVLNNSAPKYDLYSNLLLTFTNLDGNRHGFDANSTLSFIADTDNGGAPVPEPATMLLFGGGLIGLLGSKIRRKK